jgi:prevent-host-death family protein
MSRAATPKRKPRPSVAYAERVGVAEFRGNLAKYLKQASAGRPVIIQERGRGAYVLLELEDEPAPSIFGCMKDRTAYVASAVVNAAERWPSGAMP